MLQQFAPQQTAALCSSVGCGSPPVQLAISAARVAAVTRIRSMRGSLGTLLPAGQAVLVLIAALVPVRALAHARPASLGALLFDPARPGRMIARGTWGLAVSDDGGQRWRWLRSEGRGGGEGGELE